MMTNKPVFINQLPPMSVKNRADLTTQTALLNQRIADTEAEGVRPILSESYLSEYLHEEILDANDGIHLIGEGLEVFAKALKEAVMTVSDTDTDKGKKTPESERVIMTKLEAAGHIIGKAGANVKRLESTYQVSITSRKN